MGQFGLSDRVVFLSIINLFSFAMYFRIFILLFLGALVFRQGDCAEQVVKPRNVIFILSDDHRFDFVGSHKSCPKFLKTPALDWMAQNGANIRNAFVTTSLCSPSRASILTGRFMHGHRVVDNQRPVPKGTTFFPQLIQKKGYPTAFVGKWHMGHDNDAPRPGFDHWVSFKGQGAYFDPVLNTNGVRTARQGYTADILTDEALAWMKRQDKGQPYFLYLSFKSVHYPFQPAPRNKGKFAADKIDYPETMANTERNYQTQPHWVRERRYSIHGIDHMETGPFDKDPVPDFDELYKQYCETVVGIDENVGRVIDFLKKTDQLDNTLLIYTSDNGFELGEHGFYDKRDAFEHSIRVPMLAVAPGLIRPGTETTEMIQNIDIAPTVLDSFGVEDVADMKMDGESFLPILQGQKTKWRDHILYEYHWEWNFPATPTTFAIRTDRYKYIYYHGVWDHNGFYDLQTDPLERHNLIKVPAYQERIQAMRDQMFRELDEAGGLVVPVRIPKGDRLDQRKLRR